MTKLTIDCQEASLQIRRRRDIIVIGGSCRESKCGFHAGVQERPNANGQSELM
jgi:hypothetical protein